MKTCRQKQHKWKHVGYDSEDRWIWDCEKCGAGSRYNTKTRRVNILEPEENAKLKAEMRKK